MTNVPINVPDILNLHRESIVNWKQSGVSFAHQEFLALVEKNHQYNYQLWHAEDKARRDDKGAEFVRDAKRQIDRFNQARNDAMEAIDEYLFRYLKPASHTTCPVHSETPGMMIDRLSILALKHYHMGLQTKRDDVDASHKMACAEKVMVIAQQLEGLAGCLSNLLQEVAERSRTFRLYRQMKMYNSAVLNPELAAAQGCQD